MFCVDCGKLYKPDWLTRQDVRCPACANIFHRKIKENLSNKFCRVCKDPAEEGEYCLQCYLDRKYDNNR